MKKKIGTAVVVGMLAATPQAKELQTNPGNNNDKTQTELAEALVDNEQSSEKELSFDDARLKYIISERIGNMSKESPVIKQLKEYYGEKEFNEKIFSITKEITNNPQKYGRFDKKGDYSIIDEEGILYEEDNLNELIKNNFEDFTKENNLGTRSLLIRGLAAILSAFNLGLKIGKNS